MDNMKRKDKFDYGKKGPKNKLKKEENQIKKKEPENKEPLDQSLMEKEQTNLLKDYNENKDKGFILKKLTQYNLYPNKDNISSSNINKIIIVLNEKINPFKEDINKNDYFKEIKSRVNKFEKKYNKKEDIKLSSNFFKLNVTQHLKVNYKFSFKLKKIASKEIVIFNFNELDRAIIFILFNLDSLDNINKIKEIKEYEIKVRNIEEKKFSLIAMIKENRNINIKEKLKKYNLDFCYIISENIDSNLIKLFGFDVECNSKCVFIDKNSTISLILDDSIEFLTSDMINFYLERNSIIKEKIKNGGFFNGKQQISELKKNYEKDKFKECLKKFNKDFNLEIEFKEIDEMKYPVMIKFTYFKEEKIVAQDAINELENIMKENKIKFYFIGKNEKSELGEMIKSLEKEKKYIEEKIKHLEKEKNQIEEIIKRLKDDQKGNKEIIKKLEIAQREIEKQIENYKKEQISKKEKILKLKNEIKEKIKNLENEKIENKQKIVNLEKEINRKEEKIKGEEKKIEEKEFEIKTLKEKKKEKEAKIEKYEKIQKEIENIINNKKEDTKEDEIIKKFKEDQNLNKEKIKTLKEAQEEIEKIIKNKIEDPEEKELIKKLKEERNKKEEEIKNLKKYQKGIKETIENLEIIINEKEITVYIKTKDELINNAIICKKKDRIDDIIKKLYIKYPNYKERNPIYQYNNETLNLSKTLSYYNIKNNSIIYLI